MKIENLKYKRWHNKMLGMIPNTQKSVVVDYMTFPLEDNEICLGYREWCELFSCGVKTCRKFFDFLEENELISRRIIKSNQRSKTVVFIKTVVGERRGTLMNTGLEGDFSENRGERRRTLMNTGLEGDFSENRGERRGTLMNTGLEGDFSENRGERRRTLMNTGIEENEILSKISPKALEILKERPELVNKMLSRWVNSYDKRQEKKNNPDSVLPKSDFDEFIGVYRDWYKSTSGIYPKLAPKDYSAAKSIYTHLESTYEGESNHETTMKLWRRLFDNWHKLSEFNQGFVQLVQIDARFNNMISDLKSKKKRKLGDGKVDTDALREYFEDDNNNGEEIVPPQIDI